MISGLTIELGIFVSPSSTFISRYLEGEFTGFRVALVVMIFSLIVIVHLSQLEMSSS